MSEPHDRAIIRQTLEVKEWPLKEIGDEHFFGYVVGMGMFPGDWTPETHVPYVDFAYNDAYIRYRLPTDAGLRQQLMGFLKENMEDVGGGMYGKVWIRFNPTGFAVFTP